jgi:hypothetical protein
MATPSVQLKLDINTSQANPSPEANPNKPSSQFA